MNRVMCLHILPRRPLAQPLRTYLDKDVNIRIRTIYLPIEVTIACVATVAASRLVGTYLHAEVGTLLGTK
jgi:hypothetical protein